MSADKFLDLPTETLTILTAGYLAYLLAFIGKDAKHKPLDVAMLTLAFGIVTKPIFYCIPNPILAPAFSFVCALGIAVLWRSWLQEKLWCVLKKLKISSSDGHIKAFDTIRVGRGVAVYSITIKKTNGELVESRELDKFKDEKFGPCLFGEDGSIGLYVTARKLNANEEWKVREANKIGEWSKLTYIPASEISEIRLGYIVEQN